MNKKTSIEATKQGFEASFEEASFYNRQTQDEEHLQRIIASLQLEEGKMILDLGTGSGYLAFAMAKQQPDAYITGLDIVEETLVANREKAKTEQLDHLKFVSYDGERWTY